MGYMLIKELNPYEAHGPDDILPCILKQSAETFDMPFQMFKNHLEERSLSREWQRANVYIFKKSYRKLPNITDRCH